MAGTVVLERFDRSGAGPAEPVLAETDLSNLDTPDFPEMDAPPVHPPRLPDDPLAEENLVEDSMVEPEVTLEAERAALVAIVEAAERSMGELRAEVTRQAAEAAASVVMAVLPGLIDAAFAAEIAAATAEIVEAGARSDVELAVSPDEHDAVVDGLNARQPSLPVTVTSDSTIAPGCARLRWHGGGADLDAGELTRRANELLCERIAAISERNTDNG